MRDGEETKVETLSEVFERQIALKVNGSQNLGLAVSDSLNRYLNRWVRLMKIPFVQGSLRTTRLFSRES